MSNLWSHEASCFSLQEGKIVFGGVILSLQKTVSRGHNEPLRRVNYEKQDLAVVMGVSRKVQLSDGERGGQRGKAAKQIS